MKILAGLFLVFTLLTATIRAQDAADPDFARGNAAYAAALNASDADAKTLYAEAAGHYMRALQGGDSWVLHYNLANALHGMGEEGPAVLHYEKALAIKPTQPEIAANLVLARKAAGHDARRSMNFAERWALHLPLAVWLTMACGFGWATLALLALPPLHRGHSALSIGLAAVCVLGFAAGAVGLAGWHLHARWQVLLPPTPLRAAPIDDSSQLRDLPAATYVLPSRTHEAWTYVRTEAGDAGWIPSRMLEPVWKDGTAPTPAKTDS